MKGESFLLRTTNPHSEERVVIVDAGWGESADGPRKLRSERLFTAIRNEMPDVAKIDRLIITHEDRDHCEGAQPFISEWCGSGRSIEEAWLPATWSPLASAELRRSRHRSTIVEGAFYIAPEILEIAKKIAAEQSEDLSVKYMDKSDLDVLFRQAARVVATEQGTFDKIFADAVEIQDGRKDRQTIELEIGDPYPSPPIPPYSERFRIRQIWGQRIADFADCLVDGAIDTHYHISQIVGACLANHVRIRWFDFGLFERNRVAHGGDAGFLTPVNAVEVIPRPARISSVDFFLALSLSKANRECLMFLRHQQDSEPAVLFSGDSRLTTLGCSFPAPAAGLPTTNTMAVTAMHHASDQNQQGYPILSGWLGQSTPNPIFIRNGGHGVKRAASGFLTAKQRLCVRCIPMTTREQMLRLRSVGADWVMPSNAPQCTCT